MSTLGYDLVRGILIRRVPGLKKCFKTFWLSKFGPGGSTWKNTNGLITFILSLVGRNQEQFYTAKFIFSFQLDINLTFRIFLKKLKRILSSILTNKYFLGVNSKVMFCLFRALFGQKMRKGNMYFEPWNQFLLEKDPNPFLKRNLKKYNTYLLYNCWCFLKWPYLFIII